MIVWKAASLVDSKTRDHKRYVLVQLGIPTGARIRLGAFPCSKHRVEKAKVIAISDRFGHYFAIPDGHHVVSMHDDRFKYVVGQTVKPRKAFSMSDLECASGIHFFLTKKNAWAWTK